MTVIRRKFALRIYWARYRSRLLNVVIPWFQAHVRGYLQRVRFRLVKEQIRRIRMASKIANAFRTFWARKKRLEKLRKHRLQLLLIRSACLIQRVYRAHKGRQRLQRRRNQLANERLLAAQEQALRELTARKIQRMLRGFVARRRVFRLLEEKRRAEEIARIRARASRWIQRIARGKLGRMRAERRRRELQWMAFRWSQALILTRKLINSSFLKFFLI